jgi:hypothetical protein
MLVTNRDNVILSVGKQQKNIHIGLIRTLRDLRQCVTSRYCILPLPPSRKLPSVLLDMMFMDPVSNTGRQLVLITSPLSKPHFKRSPVFAN